MHMKGIRSTRKTFKKPSGKKQNLNENRSKIGKRCDRWKRVLILWHAACLMDHTFCFYHSQYSLAPSNLMAKSKASRKYIKPRGKLKIGRTVEERQVKIMHWALKSYSTNEGRFYRLEWVKSIPIDSTIDRIKMTKYVWSGNTTIADCWRYYFNPTYREITVIYVFSTWTNMKKKTCTWRTILVNATHLKPIECIIVFHSQHVIINWKQISVRCHLVGQM